MGVKTKNCHVRSMTESDIYCGRGRGSKRNPLKCSTKDSGYWGNPIMLGSICFVCGKTHFEPGSTLGCYEKYLVARLEYDSVFADEFKRLNGKRLACFCKPSPCHTDIMIKYLDD